MLAVAVIVVVVVAVIVVIVAFAGSPLSTHLALKGGIAKKRDDAIPCGFAFAKAPPLFNPRGRERG